MLHYANRGGILCFWPDADANLLTGMTLATGDKLDTKLVRSQHTTGKYVINHSLQFFNRQDEPFKIAQESKVHPWLYRKSSPFLLRPDVQLVLTRSEFCYREMAV
jgi:hypothetical protein